MPAQIPYRHLDTPIIHWAATEDEYGGFAYAAPRVLEGRWEDKQELYRRFGSGDEAVSKAVVYFMDTDINIGDFVYRPAVLDRANLPAEPTSGSWQVNAVARTPDLRNLHSLTKIWL